MARRFLMISATFGLLLAFPATAAFAQYGGGGGGGGGCISGCSTPPEVLPTTATPSTSGDPFLDPSTTPSVEVSPIVIENTPPPAPDPDPEPEAQPQGEQLAQTGFDAIEIAIAGFAMLLAGAAAIRLARPKKQ